MKKLLLLLMLFSVGITQAQIVNIPDENFKAALIAYGVDINSDGEIQESEAMAMTVLNVSGQNISDLTGIESFVNLFSFNCSSNQLESIDLTGLTLIETLKCNNNQLTSLVINDCVNLVELQCQLNQLTSLDISSNVNLVELHCYENQLTSLDVSYNENLVDINCYLNNLTILDLSNHEYLYSVNCSLNELTTLNFSNCSSLEQILFDNNQLTEIDIIDVNNLFLLVANNNNITELDLSNYFYNNNPHFNFDFNNNPIEYINLKNGIFNHLTDISIDQTTLQLVCVDDEELFEIIDLIPDFFEYENAVITSYCTFVPGGKYNTISGKAIFDYNNNGCDVNDSMLLNVRVDINDGVENGSIFTNYTGDYNFYTQDGDFTLTPNIENPSWFNFSPPETTISFTDNNSNIVSQDFCVTSVGVHNDLEVVLASLVPAQPGFDATYYLVYRNKGNQTLSGEIGFDYNDAVLDYASASISPNSQTTGNLMWDYTDLLPFESRSFSITLNVNSPMETPAINIGDILTFSSSINPIAGDETPTDNTFILNQTVVGSYDPNDITCLEGDIVSPEKIGEYLHYNINFENTGTAAATFVVVKDEIDNTQYDISTLQILYASHDMFTRVNGDTIEFIFEDINLGPNEKGNVLFKLKTKNTLSTGDTVANKADIYFDYNFPIETNNANTTFQALSVSEFEESNIKVFPNPTSSLINIQSNTLIEEIEIFDLKGALLLKEQLGELNYQLNISNFINGVYFLKIRTQYGEQTQKIVKY